MSILRENIVYTILALVAIVLIGVTIGLQLVIITGQNPTVVTGAAQQATQQALENSGQQVAFAVATVTETPAVLIIQPAPAGGAQSNAVNEAQESAALADASQADASQVDASQVDASQADESQAEDSPADTAQLPDTPAEVTIGEPTATEAAPSAAVERLPTETPTEVAPPTTVPPTPVPPTPAPPTATNAPAVEPTLPPPTVDSDLFRIGFANRGYGCPVVSQIVARIIEEQFATPTELISYDTVEGMFVAVANNEVKMTLCYLDPEDRELLRGDNKRTIGFKMVQLGSQYWENEGQKLQMWVNLPTMGELREADRSCLLNFLYSLRFEESDLQALEADSWLSEHGAEIEEWARCGS